MERRFFCEWVVVICFPKTFVTYLGEKLETSLLEVDGELPFRLSLPVFAWIRRLFEAYCKAKLVNF